VIVDTSAIIAILRDEPEAKAFAEAIAGAVRRRVSAATYVEAAAVIDSSADPVASRRLDDLFQEAEFVIESVTAEQARVARDAYRGSGRASTRKGK
jgi:ribonuclease VapC